MSKEQIIKLIIEICCGMDANILLMMAIADIESRFEQHKDTNIDNNIGLYQIGDGYVTDCFTNFGINLINKEKRKIDHTNQIKCTWKNIERSKNFGLQIQTYYGNIGFIMDFINNINTNAIIGDSSIGCISGSSSAHFFNC